MLTADDAKTTAEKTAAPVRDEAAVEALMKTRFLAVGGVKGTFDACKAEIKKAKDAYVLNKDVVIKKKESGLSIGRCDDGIGAVR